MNTFLTWTRWCVVLVVSAMLGGCGANPIKHLEGKTYYTQLNLWVDRDEHITTNYRVGWRIPVNSRIKILDTSGDKIKFEVLDKSTEVVLVNEEGYSGLDIAGIRKRYFGEERVDLSRFDEQTRSAIERGQVESGMARDAVLLARGYPPVHRTPDLEGRLWTYWRNRFAKQTVAFAEDEVQKKVGF